MAGFYSIVAKIFVDLMYVWVSDTNPIPWCLLMGFQVDESII